MVSLVLENIFEYSYASEHTERVADLILPGIG